MRNTPSLRLSRRAGRRAAAPVPFVLLATLAAGLPAAPGRAQGAVPGTLRFEQVVSEPGLSETTFSLVQDRQGFLWIGTAHGLNRYDGYGFRAFTAAPEEASGLADDEVPALAADRHGRLWVATRRGGLHRWQPSTETFERWPAPGAPPDALPGSEIHELLADGDTLWIGTGAGLVRATLGADGSVAFTPGPSPLVSADPVRALHRDRRGRLWVGTDRGGLARLDPGAAALVPVPLQVPGETGTGPAVAAMAEDREGGLWVGTHDHGLFHLDAAGHQELHLGHREGDPQGLASDRIRSLWSDPDGLLWVATNRGLNVRDEQGALEWIGYDPDDPNSLSDDSLWVLYADRAGVLWVGSNAGLDKLAARPSLFEHLRENPADPGSLASNRVTAFAEDRSGVLWVGTFDTGLSRRDPASGRFSVLGPAPGRRDTLPDLRVMSLAVDREDDLWVGTLAGGLSRVDAASGAVTTFRHDPSDPDSLAYDGVTAILEDPSGDLWIGTYRGGLDRFEPATGRFRHHPAGEGGLSSPQVRDLELESPRELWVGTGDAGIDLLDPATGAVRAFRHDPASPASLRSDAVLSLLLAQDRTLWIGTDAGLEGWPAAERAARRASFRHYGETEGLLGLPVWGILEDARGSLWLSTNRGLTRFDPDTQTFTNFGRSHGLPREGFKFGAYLEGADGTLYFGSNQGVTTLDPTRFAAHLRRPTVVVTRVFTDNQPQILFADPAQEPRVELGYRTNVVAFELAVLDFLAPELNRFEHKLEGFDPDWTDLAEGRRATYTNLPPGAYTLRVRGATSEGVWSSAEPATAVIVEAPPWATWWAYALYGLAAAGTILLYSRHQTDKLEREAETARRLEVEIQARTRALEEQNERLQYANRLLEIASVTDSLTGVHNRRFLLTSVERDIAHIDRLHADAVARGESEPASFLFLICDLDGFKEINDRLGHSAGDLVLFQIRDLLSRACRGSDTLVRWGGDEFMIVGRSASREHIEVLAERVRRSVANHLFDVGASTAVHLTCSVGFSSYPFVGAQPRLYGWEDVVELADKALLLAKRRGPDMWVGVFGTERTAETPFEDLLALVNDRPELLAAEGSIVLRSSPYLAEASLRTGT